MKIEIYRRGLGGACLLLAMALMQSPQALGKDNISFRGVLVTGFSGCKLVNPNGGEIDVDFGDRVVINMVDGKNYSQMLDWGIDCDSKIGEGEGGEDNTIPVNNIILTLKGQNASFDPIALQTSNEFLGIRIYSDDKPLKPGVPFGIEELQMLYAVPVKKTGVAIKTGPFQATATITVDIS